jgi:hypothetical protein
MRFSEVDGQGIRQFGELGCAFGLSTAIGLECDIRHNSAAYLSREGWTGVGAAPKATNNFVYTSLRCYIP